MATRETREKEEGERGGRDGKRGMRGRRRGGRGRSDGRAGESSEPQNIIFLQSASINSPDIVYVSLVSELSLPGRRKRGPVKLFQREWMK